MSSYNFFRPLTSEEKIDTINVGTEDILSLFLKKLAEAQSVYQKNLRPFDSYSAKIDFETRIRNKINDLATTVDRNTDRTVEFGDLNEYGNIDRFEFIERSECRVTKVVAGTLNDVSIGFRYKFRCKSKGNRISIYVEHNRIDEFEKWLNEEFLKDSKLIKKAPEKEMPEEVVEPVDIGNQEPTTTIESKVAKKKIAKKVAKQ